MGAQRKYLAAVEVCVWRDGKILVCTNRRWGKFTCPGGKIEEGEEPDDAAARELLEETGCKAVTLRRVAGNIHKAMSHDPANLRWFCIAYDATIGDQEPRQVEEGTEPFWVTPEKLCTESLFPEFYSWLLKTLGYHEHFFAG